MLSYLFYLYGNICTKFPLEVIVFTITIITCTFTMNQIDLDSKKYSLFYLQEDSIVDTIIMTLIKCLAVLYCYYQFRNLKRMGSKYILIVAVLFTIFSSLAFTSTVINLLRMSLSDLKDAIFLFLLLIDLSKATTLAQFALNGNNRCEVKNNIAKGLSMLGPKITLDTIVETLIIGIGTLSGVPRLEMLSYFACISIVINYFVFMTFYLSSLSLILELSKKGEIDESTLMCKQRLESKTNPVTQNIKIIMAIGLLLVHLNNKWSMKHTSDYLTYSHSIRWMKICTDHGIGLIILFVLVIKFIFSEIRHEETDLEHISTTQVATRVSVGTQLNSGDANTLTDDEVIKLVLDKTISIHRLERFLNDTKRAVLIRRKIISMEKRYVSINSLPFDDFDYDKLLGACCENVIGYVPVPLGIVGPLMLDGVTYHIPMATTEGCLIASTIRGCKATSINGITSQIVNDGMTRGPIVRFPTANRAAEAITWIEENFSSLKEQFDASSNYARLTKLHTRIAGRCLFIRFIATTGDAMGMNMLSKGTELSLNYLKRVYPDMEILSLSGNFCTDKKAAYVNWLEGRGKSVVCEAIVPSSTVTSLLKTTVPAIIDVNISKNLIGSAMAGTVGGNNSHAANIVTAIFIATGQDPAQNVVSSNCMTLMEPWGVNGDDLCISCTMPSIEVGTVGGGTILPAQAACLDILGVKGGNVRNPGKNASQLAQIVCATVLAGELSLLAALSSGDLVSSHLKHNRAAT